MSSPEEVAAELGDRALISLTGDGDSLAAVVVRDGKIRLVPLGPLAEAVEAAKQLHADLDALAPDHLPERLAEAVTESARRRADTLDKLIVRPLEDLIGDRELVIVPIGPLYAVPWGALPTLRGRAVSIVPSATAWVAASSRPRAVPVLLAGGPGVPGSIGEVRKLRAVYPEARLVDPPRRDQRGRARRVGGRRDGTPRRARRARRARAGERLVLAAGTDRRAAVRTRDRAAEPTAGPGRARRVRARDEPYPGGGRSTRLRRDAAGERLADGHWRDRQGGDKAAAEAMSDLHQLLAAGTSPAVALAEATAADPLRRPFLCLGAG